MQSTLDTHLKTCDHVPKVTIIPAMPTPWSPENVPVGAVIRLRGESMVEQSLITGVSGWISGFIYHEVVLVHWGPEGSCRLDDVAFWRNHEWKWPHEPSTAWRPCCCVV